jgi:hypothetical protein
LVPQQNDRPVLGIGLILLSTVFLACSDVTPNPLAVSAGHPDRLDPELIQTKPNLEADERPAVRPARVVAISGDGPNRPRRFDTETFDDLA